MNAMQPSTAFRKLAQLMDLEFAMNTELMDGVQILDAGYLIKQYYPQIDVGLPLLIRQVWTEQLLSELQATLLNAYPAKHELVLIQRAGLSGEKVIPLFLDELAEQKELAQCTNLCIPPLPKGSSFSHLQETVAHLRSPEGCPWDRKQTLITLRSDLLDECTEVMDAIDREAINTGVINSETINSGAVNIGEAQAEAVDNSAHIAEELGDVLMVVNLMIQIATEEGRFQMADVTSGIVTKLIRRHPHVFENLAVDGIDGINANWERIKAEEKAERGERVGGPLDGVPTALPALEKACQLQSKAAKVGLLDRAALAKSQPIVGDLLGKQPDEKSVGALLWQLVAASDQAGINPENALREHIVQFRQESESETEKNSIF